MPNPRDEIYEGYIRAREQGMSAKQYLDIIAPTKRGRSDASASRYLRKLRTGERSGTQLYARAKRDAGKSVQVVGEIGGRKLGANIRLPMSGSRIALTQDTLKLQEYILSQSQRNTPGQHDDEHAQDIELKYARSVERTPSGTKDIGKI